MTGYVIDPTQPFPRRWEDKIGSIRLLMVRPVEGWLLARGISGVVFAISVKDLLGGKWRPILPSRRTNARSSVGALSEGREGEKG